MPKKYAGTRVCVLLHFDRGFAHMLSCGRGTIRTFPDADAIDQRIAALQVKTVATTAELAAAAPKRRADPPVVLPVKLAMEAFGFKRGDFADLEE